MKRLKTKYMMEKENSLAAKRPELILEWHTKNNGELTPWDVSAFSSKKIWWECKYGHEWIARIYHRSYGCGCPICASERKTSFAEQAIWFYLKQLTLAENRYTGMGKEIDIFLPELRIGIEHNGKYYHKGKEHADQEKIRYYTERNIKIITVKEGESEYLKGNTIEYIYYRKASLNWAISTLISMLGFHEIFVDVLKDEHKIYEQYDFMVKENSLAVKLPDIAAEWHPTKNGKLKPEMVSYASGKRVWWLCKHGHEWRTQVANRKNGRGCPVCSGKQILVGFNDLATTNPELAAEWDHIKNGDLTPRKISRGSRKAVWWMCVQGHTWNVSVAARVRGENCPYCSNKRVLAGFNDLRTTKPQLAREWNYLKNMPLTPESVTHGSDKSVWWQCARGHEWKAVIGDRSSGNGCPFCSGRNLIIGENDLTTIDPALAAEWHPNKNGAMKAQDVTAVSGREVWWLCSKGHEWKAKISNRHWGNGCPYCANRKVMAGYNDLRTTHPRLADEWNVEKNCSLLPDEFMAGSGKKVWWRCENNHEWEARILSRSRGTGCPHCHREKRSRNTLGVDYPKHMGKEK